MRRRLQQSGLARGCVNTWANSSPPSPDRLEMAQGTSSVTASDEDVRSEVPPSGLDDPEELQEEVGEEEEASASFAPVA